MCHTQGYNIKWERIMSLATAFSMFSMKSKAFMSHSKVLSLLLYLQNIMWLAKLWWKILGGICWRYLLGCFLYSTEMLFPPKWIFTVHQTKIASTEFLKHRSSELHSMHCSILCIKIEQCMEWSRYDRKRRVPSTLGKQCASITRASAGA